MAPEDVCKWILVCLFLMVMQLETFSPTQETGRCGQCVCKNTTADCSGRNISQVPAVIPVNITDLILHQNVIAKLNDSQFANFTNLITLDLSINHISEINHDAFKGLQKLTYLYLDGNPLPYVSGAYTDFLFRSLQNLVLLRINGSTSNYTSDYPDNSLQHLKKLESLYIDGLPNKTFGPGFAGLKRLWTLVLNGSRGHCNLEEIYKNTFSNLKFLKKVYIKNCSLSYIEPGSFSHMKNLTTLDLSGNVCLGIEGVTNATQGLSRTNIKRLHANRVETYFPFFVSVPDQFAINLQNTSLTTIELNENKIIAFGNNALYNLPKTLTNVSIRDNRFTIAPYIMQIPCLSGLKELDLSGKSSKTIHNIPSTPDFFFISCPRRRNRNFTYVEEASVKLDCTTLSPFFGFPVPRNMTTLKYSNAQIYLHITEVHIGNNSITKLDLSDNTLTAWKGPVYGLNHLRYLDLSNNRAGYLNPKFFDNFPNLTFLNISRNYIGKYIGQDIDGKLFKNLANLQTLDLTENLIKIIHFKTFSHLRSLKHLSISHNKISVFPIFLKDRVSLKFIDLKDNQFRWLSPDVIAKLESNNVQLDISGNPLDCNCDNLQFLHWITTTILLNNHTLSSYTCIDANGRKQSFANISDINEVYLYLDTSCHYFSLAIGTASAFLFSMTLLTVGLLYRYRWKLRYWYYAAKHKYHQSTTYQSTSEFYYDAFVSFADGDRGFVVNELVNRLEQEGGISLNIHQRDFTAGRPIAENIIEAIQKSRRTLCVLSRDFLESYWCKYELQMANMESVTTGRDVLLIVMMEHIPTERIPAEILYHIQSDSYIQYPAEGGTDMFWRNLIHSLKT